MSRISAVLGLLAAASLAPAGTAPVFTSLTRTHQGDGPSLIRKGVTGAAHYIYRALATFILVGPAQAQQIPEIPGLTVTAPSATSLHLNWNAIEGTRTYIVQWSGQGPHHFPKENFFFSATATTTTINNLVAGRTYTCIVIATGRDAESGHTTWLAQSEVTVTLGPEIDVQGNGVTIPDNDTTPGTADHTDFGPALRTGGKVSRTFTIRNTGLRALALTGTPKVAVSGANASDFTVTAQPSSPVAALSGTTTFTVEFDPSGQAERTATLSITNDDSNKNPYNFDIKGRGVNLVLTFIGEATNRTATEDEAFTYTAPAATVLDSSASLTYTAALTNGDDLPGWLTFTDSTRTFSGTPGEADAPATLNIRVTVTAGDMTDTTDFVLTVEEAVSTLPTANAGADQTGKRGGTVTLAGAGTLNADGSQEPLT